MRYLKKFSSLEERATREVAINLCQDSNFKAVALCLENPTYGFFYLEGELPIFVNNPRKLLVLEESETQYETIGNKMYRFSKRHANINIRQQDKNPPFINDPRILSIWENSGNFIYDLTDEDIIDEISIGKWYTRIEEMSKKLTEDIPQSLRLKTCVWMKRIALEYISYCRRQEVLFGISRYFLMSFLTRGDWMETCRLDEKKLAERLVKDEQLTLLNRYHIACVYCLLDYIPLLWNKLAETEKNDIDNDLRSNHLVRLWSLNRNMRENPSYEFFSNWHDIVRRLIVYGNLSIIKPFWKGMKENERQDRVIDMAVESLKCCSSNSRSYFESRDKLLSSKVNPSEYSSITYYTLQSHYYELILFFLSEMDDDQQLSFFEQTLKNEDCNILKCFLHWNLRDYFLQTMNRLWGIIMPMDRYSERETFTKFEACFEFFARLCSVNVNITLTLEFSENFKFYYDRYLKRTHPDSFSLWVSLYDCYCKSLFEKENQNYDYRSLLWKLWEETPQPFKQHLFAEDHFMLFTELSKKSPFQKDDEALFKLIFRDLPKTDRTPMIYSIIGEEICSILLEKGKLSFVDWLLAECLAEDQISFYKIEFIQSKSGIKLCIYKLLQQNSEKSLTDLLDWSFEWDAEKSQFKQELVDEYACLTEIELLLSRGEFSEAERIMNFCFVSKTRFQRGLKEDFKVDCAKSACVTLIKNWKIEQVDKILEWCFDVEGNRKNFKADIFIQVGIKTHCWLVFLERWEDVEKFYEWFNLSPQEIRQLKYNTALKGFEKIDRRLYRDTDLKKSVELLYRCLTDEEMVISFKSDVEKKYLVGSDSNAENETLSYLVKELLRRIRKDTRDKATVCCPVLRKRKKERSPDGSSRKCNK